MNTFHQKMTQLKDMTYTENGGVAHKTTHNKVYDMFGVGGAYRTRSEDDCIFLFKQAFDEDADLAMKCLFYLRDCRGGGQGERRFFRVVYNWLAKNGQAAARKNMKYIPEFGRWDDLFCLFGTPLELDMLRFIAHQFKLDLACETPSLLGKWMPSCNTSSRQTVRLAHKIRKFLGINEKEYRQYLVLLRKKINIIEALMSQNRWDEIRFDQIPSKAGLKYRNAFARHDIIAQKYEQFIKNKNTKVNAKTLFPYEIVAEAAKRVPGWNCEFEYISTIDRAALEKYWNALPNYCEGNDSNLMCVVDTSASMTGSQAAAPINVAIALGMYCAERLDGPFKNHFISFSSRPQYIAIEGIDFVDKVRRIYKQNLCENTNLKATFDLIYNTAMREDVRKEDVPDTIVVISDMEIDYGTTDRTGAVRQKVKTMMECQRDRWVAAGLKPISLIYWNVDSRDQNKFLDDGDAVTYVSGASPTIFEAILKGKSGIDVMIDILTGERYKEITC